MKITTMFAIIATLTLATLLGCNLYVGVPGISETQCQSAASRLFSDSTVNVFDQFNTTITNIVASGATALIIATVVFPNPFTLFAPITLMLLSYAVLPSDIFYFFGIPDPFGFYLTNLMIVFMVLTVLGWYKGTET